MTFSKSPETVVKPWSASTNRWATALFSLAFLLLGCNNNSSSSRVAKPTVAVEPSNVTIEVKPSAGPTTVQAVKTRLHTGDPLTDEQCQTFAKELVELIYAGKASQAQDLVDSNAILDVAFAGLEQSERDRALQRVFRDAYLNGIKQANGFETLSKLVQNGASVKFLNIRREKSDIVIILRVLIEPNGFDYHRFTLARRPEGVRIVDGFVMRQGEPTSAHIRRIFLQGMAADNQRIAENLAPDKSPSLQTMQQIKLMTGDMATGRYQEYLDKYDKLPEEFKSDMTLLAMRVDSAKRISNDLFLQVVSDVRRRKPDNPAIDIMCLDALVAQKDFDEAHACLDRIDRSIGSDPFLLVLHADYFFQAGDRKSAKATAVKALAADSSLIGAHWLLVHISLQEKDFATTCRVLERLETDHKIALASFLTQDIYAEFIKSQEYKAWSKANRVATPIP